MDEETQKKYDEAIASAEEATKALEAEKATIEEERSTYKTEKETLEKTISEKNLMIEQKSKDVIGARRKYKKLSDMSDEERDSLTEKELELQKRQEEQEERQQDFEKRQQALTEKEVTARKNNAILKFAGEDKELAEKIFANYDRIKDAETASTNEEVAKIASEAFNMLGTPKGDGVESVINSGGNGKSGEGDKTDFSETSEGKEIAGALGLNQALDETKK